MADPDDISPHSSTGSSDAVHIHLDTKIESGLFDEKTPRVKESTVTDTPRGDDDDEDQDMDALIDELESEDGHQ